MNRNLIVEYANDTVAILGDVHLGKKFKTGVPVGRLGEREKMVWQDFIDSLMEPSPDVTIHVCMGDLFDKTIVDYQTIFGAFHAYLEACNKFPDRQYIIIMGNHDMSRNADRYSSFRIFSQMLATFPNLKIVTTPWNYNGFGFIPYHPFNTAAEMIRIYRENYGTLDTYAVFGHWDIDTFNSEMPHNLFPAEDIFSIPNCRDAYTGHVHTPEVRSYGDNELTIVGSMQPYSFSEDKTGELYITIPYGDLFKYDVRSLKNKCVRVLLSGDETLPELDCLQLIGKRAGDSEVDDDIDVEMVAFDMQVLMREELTKAGVISEKTIGFIFSEYDKFRAEE